MLAPTDSEADTCNLHGYQKHSTLWSVGLEKQRRLTQPARRGWLARGSTKEQQGRRAPSQVRAVRAQEPRSSLQKLDEQLQLPPTPGPVGVARGCKRRVRLLGAVVAYALGQHARQSRLQCTATPRLRPPS